MMAAPMELKQIKVIIISDGTGETATSVARAAMPQFEGKDVFFTRYKNVRDETRIDSIFKKAAMEHDVIIYTIVSAKLREYIKKIARKKTMRTIDLLGPILTAFSNVLGQGPREGPGLLHKVDDEYFNRMSSMEFTINHDDGQNLKSLHLADVVLIGASRTSKTPLSIYLSQHGIKVANIPLIYGVSLPRELFDIDQRKIFALAIEPAALKEIRKKRLDQLGVGGGGAKAARSREYTDTYADEEKILQEIQWTYDIFKSKKWPVLNVTNRALEETAADIIKLINRRKNNPFKK